MIVQNSAELLHAIADLLPYLSSVGVSDNDKVEFELEFDTKDGKPPEY